MTRYTRAQILSTPPDQILDLINVGQGTYFMEYNGNCLRSTLQSLTKGANTRYCSTCFSCGMSVYWL